MKLRKSKQSRGSGWPDRRDFLKLPLAAAATQTVSTGPFVARGAARIDEYDPNNTKIATQIDARSNDDQLLFLQQIGVRWVHAQFPLTADLDMMKNAQDRMARYNIKIHQGTCEPIYHSLKIQLGQPGRDEDIEKFQAFIRNLGRLKVYSSKIDFHPGNTYTTDMITTERGYKVRQYDVQDFHNKVEKQKFYRIYTAEDMWANYTYFIKAVLPVAEKADVRLALHPDDPPTAASAMMNGVAKMFTDYNGYQRADEVAGHSPYWGLTFCVGTWSEGGTQMGKDVFGIIDDFGARGKIFAVHFRNVISPLPRFHETFQDDGYQDMYQIMKAFRKVKCTASLIPDHYPQLVNDPGHRIADTYSITYMRALLRRANEEVG